jgi:Phosphoenolpyruvate synthase/pyruvate phosphate dikinase
LRLGDNVVWQADSVIDYAYFVRCFVQQALREQRRLVYIRFGQHRRIVQDDPLIKVYYLEPVQGFESFSAQVHEIATQEGRGVYYVFDCLSDLLSTWATDLMIGNFFRVTCPYLFELDTIAYFCLLRNRNSNDTIARIRETTQLFLDVYHQGEQVLVHPLKVWNRYSPTMFLPHVRVGEDFVPITSSMEASLLFSSFNWRGPGNVESKLDYWDRVFLKAQEMVERVRSGEKVSAQEEKEMVEQLCRMMIGREDKVLSLAYQYFTLEDLLEIRNRLLGSGFIGGKSVGMLLARKILQADPQNNWENWLEQHDSFYIGADVYYTFLVENGCWNLRLEQKKEESYFSAAAVLREKILTGEFPGAIRDQLNQMLDYYGQSPIIIRSSSLLEDGFGNAFAGKYESVFCVNQGELAERYATLEKAVKTVYASTMSDDALTYRWQRGMAGSDEQMALLVQRVSGSHHGYYFFPDLAGWPCPTILSCGGKTSAPRPA